MLPVPESPSETASETGIMPSGEAAAVADELTSADEALRYISHMAGRVWLCYISPNKYAALMVGAGIIHPTVMDRRCAVVM